MISENEQSTPCAPRFDQPELQDSLQNDLPRATTSPRPPFAFTLLLAAITVAGSFTTSCARGEAVTSQKAAAQPKTPVPVPTPLAPSTGHALHGRLLRLLNRIRKGGKTAIEYIPPSTAQRSRYAQTLVQTFQSRGTDAAGPATNEEFEVTIWRDQNIVIVAEPISRRRGAGAVVFRADASPPLVIEAPHTFFDSDTLPIALHLFEGLKAQALVVNTVHRARNADKFGGPVHLQARSGKLDSDVAHQSASQFSTAHQTLTRVIPNLITIQVHGYSDSKLPNFDVVVSAARTRANANTIAARLRAQIPALRVGVYPVDTRQLGGTTNAQARHSREVGTPFLHIELSRSLRTRLLDEPQIRQRFVQALVSSSTEH